MQWNARAFLGGPDRLANLFNANIFYPFPLTLAYSEHFLMMSAQVLPLLLLSDSHLLGLNFSVLLTFVLSGYAMYLLVTGWTGQRWAGLVAGLLFAFSPHRFGQLNHLELLVTQWMPLTLLALHWTLTRPGRRYPWLFALFFNLQALSGFHFSLNLAIACALLALVYGLAGRIYWRPGLWAAAILSIVVTVLLNWPVWRMYLRFSDVMGAIRTPGEVRIYSAALTDYLTAIPYNLLYGWTFGRWQSAGHQFQPLMPVGIVGLLLACAGLAAQIKTGHKQYRTNFTPRASNFSHPPSRPLPVIIFLILLTLLALLFSFGLNEDALGPGLAPLLKVSPYRWLYDHVAAFRGIRVPGRYGILVVIGLVGLAGWGAAYILRLAPTIKRTGIVAPALAGLILLESWSAPLAGPQFPAGEDIPPVYHWLRQETPLDAVVLELPFAGPSEFIYEYYSSYHWRRLANGGTGFTPPIYKALRQWFKAFPDARSVDIIQQMGIDLVILHPDSYPPDAWQRLLTSLPRYLPAIEQIEQVGDALVLRIAKPFCQPQPGQVQATVQPAELDGLANAVEVTYHNGGPAAFVADVQQTSRLTFAAGAAKNFTEPLVTPAGETQSVIVPLPGDQPGPPLSGARLFTLQRTVTPGETQPQPDTNAIEPWQPLGLNFFEGPQLVAYSTGPATPTACSLLRVALNWMGGQAGDRAVVQLLDPFGQVVAESEAQPWAGDGQDQVDLRILPLAGSLPAGRYGLRVRVRAADGIERLPVTAEGVTIPADQIPPLPLVIRPVPRPFKAGGNFTPPPRFGQAVTLLGSQLAQNQVSAGGWLRFSLGWQLEQPIEAELTVFTQLLGPDGQVWGQRDNQPGGGWYGFPLWPVGQPVIDDYAFQIQPDAPPGAYRLIAGLYRSDTLERLSTQTGADFVEIATVIVK